MRTRVPNWHVLLPAELAWAALGDRAALGDWTGVSRGALCSPQSVCSPAVMFSRLLCCSLRALHLSARAGVPGTGRQASFCSQWAQAQGQPHHGGAQVAALAALQCWLAVLMAAQPVWRVQPVKNPTAHVA